MGLSGSCRSFAHRGGGSRRLRRRVGRNATGGPADRVRTLGAVVRLGRCDAYPELAQKAGLLTARLTRNHPLPDGNKRVAWLAMVEFIERNGFELRQPDVDEAVRTMFALAAGDLSEQDFVDWLRPRLRIANVRS